jgi:membrane fusion protein (multidrug efflux system)
VNPRIYRKAAFAVALAFIVACQKDEDDTPPAGAKSGAAPGGRSGRPAPSITLTANNVAVIGRASIEEATSISGDLRPIETVEVRSRLEGDMLTVSAREGQRVTEGQVLARFEPSEQESNQRSAVADSAAAAAELTNAQWNLEQSATLLKAGALSQRDYRVAEQAVSAAKAKVAAAEARIRATMSAVTDTRVLAPTTGVISRRAVENGEHVARGASLFSIVRDDVLELMAAVPSRALGAVRVGHTVNFVVDGRQVSGRVARINPSIDPVTRAGTAYIEVANGGGQLRSGSFATGRIVNRVLAGALVVPLQALHQTQGSDRSFVYRIDGKAIDIATVSLGVTDDRLNVTEVLSGLAEGDRVVVGNVGTIGRGMQVTILGDENPRGGGRRGTKAASDSGRGSR